MPSLLAWRYLASRSPRMPHTIESIQQLMVSQHLSNALLMDPWDTPYRASGSTSRWSEDVNQQSAGPDKHFGTGDDLTIELSSRNVFAVPAVESGRLAVHV